MTDAPWAKLADISERMLIKDLSVLSAAKRAAVEIEGEISASLALTRREAASLSPAALASGDGAMLRRFEMAEHKKRLQAKARLEAAQETVTSAANAARNAFGRREAIKILRSRDTAKRKIERARRLERDGLPPE